MNRLLELSRVLLGCGAIVAAVAISGCNNNPHAQRIETCDSLLTVMEELNVLFANIDYDKHFENRADMMKDIERVERYFKTANDTMPRDIAFKVSDYRLIWKGYKRMEGEYGQVEKELEYTTNQLEHLRKDLEHKTLTEPMAERFLKEEKTAVAMLDVSTRSIKTKLENTEKKYQDQKPVIIQLADSLENSEN